MNKNIENLIQMALHEDIGDGDITTESIIGSNQKAKAIILAKQDGIIAGLPLAKIVFVELDKKITFKTLVKDGSKVKKGTKIAEISGNARAIVSGERLALNLLQRLSGIATLTSQFVAKTKGTKAKILDTRKTMPLWRGADKYAVLAGGGANHRFGLYDAILIKDNHLMFASIAECVSKCRNSNLKIEVEVKNIAEVKEAINAGADRILLDNMSVKTLRDAVKLCKKAKIDTEASGGITLDNVCEVAKTGVDYISIGALTHSPKALDISLEIIKS